MNRMVNSLCFFLGIVLLVTGCGAEQPKVELLSQSQELSGEDMMENSLNEVTGNEISQNGVILEEGSRSERTQDGEMGSTECGTVSVAENALTVYICGAVVHPGVVSLPDKSRINDALQMAGGFTEDADDAIVNLAEFVVDGMKIYIPKEGEVITEDSSSPTTSMSTRIDINKAGITELCTLPGIGESRAKDIIAYREKNGAFRKVEDLMKVSGIKESTFQKIEDYIEVAK